MSYLIEYTDFIGYWGITSSTYNSDELQDYIDQFEKQISTELFGKATFKDMKISPLQQKYVDLLDNGYKELLLGWIYFYYVRDNFENTSTGNFVLNAENSSNIGNSFNYSVCKARYNNGTFNWNDYTTDFLQDYGTITEEVLSSVTIGQTSTLTVESTEYLKDGDSVFIGMDKFIVSNLTAATIDITTSTDYTGEMLTWHPFGSEFSTLKKPSII